MVGRRPCGRFFLQWREVSCLDFKLAFPFLPRLMAKPHPPMPLKGVVQKYTWGKTGSESAVAKLAGAYETVDESQHYAGAWTPRPCWPSDALLPARIAILAL